MPPPGPTIAQVLIPVPSITTAPASEIHSPRPVLLRYTVVTAPVPSVSTVIVGVVDALVQSEPDMLVMAAPD